MDIRKRRLSTPTDGRLDRVFATSIVATDEDLRVLAATVGRGGFEVVALSALDRGVAALAGQHETRSSVFWQVSSEPIVVVTDARPPFSSQRFRNAVAELGCIHCRRRA